MKIGFTRPERWGSEVQRPRQELRGGIRASTPVRLQIGRLKNLKFEQKVIHRFIGVCFMLLNSLFLRGRLC